MYFPFTVVTDCYCICDRFETSKLTNVMSRVRKKNLSINRTDLNKYFLATNVFLRAIMTISKIRNLSI